MQPLIEHKLPVKIYIDKPARINNDKVKANKYKAEHNSLSA